MKKMLNKSNIFSFILGALIFGGVTSVFSFSFFAQSVGYTPKNPDFEVDNVKDALDLLEKSIGTFSNIEDQDAKIMINSLKELHTTTQELLETPYWLNRLIKGKKSFNLLHSNTEYLSYVFNTSNGMESLAQSPYALDIVFKNDYSSFINSQYISNVDAYAIQVPTMTSNSSPSGEASSSYDGLAPYLAFDKKSDSSSSRSAWVGQKYANGYVQYKFDKPNRIYKLTLENLFDGGSNYVTSFTLQGSNDGENFTDLYTGNNGSGNNAKRSFLIPTLQERYQYYRVNINAKGGNWPGFGEVNFYCFDV
ncbi:MAG: discoidin domain-containing protein [Bacilli bacterium]|nr:discoidin domain-containing protein [Bacilli bacterium]